MGEIKRISSIIPRKRRRDIKTPQFFWYKKSSEKFFKVRLSIQVGRSHAIRLKKSEKIHEMNHGVFHSSSKKPPEGKKEVSFSLKKRKLDNKMILPKDGDSCRETMIQKEDLESQFESILDDWNTEFIKEADLLRHELIETCTKIISQKKALKTLAIEKSILQEDTEAPIEDISLKAIEEFKKSSAYHQKIQDHIREAYEKLFNAEVKDLERQSYEEGFARSFMKGVCLVQRKTVCRPHALYIFQTVNRVINGSDHVVPRCHFNHGDRLAVS
ncbi:hypothetical protein IEQ34_017571 [Dendrobium chrysotoxum]|uniref:Uncharacterized protein n=1 Tax=Dendrobium chrysotoxum TaxID=161865 RepID=A0AAV7GBR8_DENCH|nr:hypothetical protein IEQ34_017571 [Dendrobium chrysotoxum]